MRGAFLALFALASFAVAAQLDSSIFEADRLFNAGNDLAATDFQAATENWRKAADILEDAVNSERLKNGPLFYNLGNIYFRLGDMGKAILNYKKAEYYMPGDGNLIRNLAIARRARKDKVDTQESTRVLKTVFFWHYDFSIFTREKIFLIAFSLLFIMLMAHLRFRNMALAWLIVLSATTVIVSGVSICITEYDIARHPAGVILAESVVARTGYSESYEKSFAEPLHAGTEFRLLGTRADWLEIQLSDGNTAWIPAKDAGIVN